MPLRGLECRCARGAGPPIAARDSRCSFSAERALPGWGGRGSAPARCDTPLVRARAGSAPVAAHRRARRDAAVWTLPRSAGSGGCPGASPTSAGRVGAASVRAPPDLSGPPPDRRRLFELFRRSPTRRHPGNPPPGFPDPKAAGRAPGRPPDRRPRTTCYARLSDRRSADTPSRPASPSRPARNQATGRAERRARHLPSSRSLPGPNPFGRGSPRSSSVRFPRGDAG